MTSNGSPSDMEFAAYWDDIDTELATLSGATDAGTHCQAGARTTSPVTRCRLTSLGAYRIFGYLSVPVGEGPFPALLSTPRYGSVNNPPPYVDRLRYVALTIMHRGQRLADTPFAARYPGLLTEGIADEKTYIYRGIVADCLRAAEFLAGLPDVDQARMAVAGDDLAVLTAARRPGFRRGTGQRRPALPAAGRVRARLRLSGRGVGRLPARALRTMDRRLRRTLAFFDAGRHAAAVRGTPGVDVRIDAPDDGSTPGRMASLATAPRAGDDAVRADARGSVRQRRRGSLAGRTPRCAGDVDVRSSMAVSERSDDRYERVD